ncbi:MAG: phosphoglycerate dehydrogenase [Christensenellaceae bacterium]|jgi:D-3-phosphoglycerate dehydrogenase|nr:phosphoglycerate dehydrogenase [Christensenellaceae bacterium]
MFKVQTLSSISPIIHEELDSALFTAEKEPSSPDAILVRSTDMLLMELPSSLLSIARAGAGYNNIPVDRCTERGIVVFNTPGANANAVKELAVAALLLAARDILGGIDWAKGLKGKGAEVPALVEKGKNQFVGPELQGKTLGVLGLGAVGGPIANVATHLHMKVLGFDPFISVENAWGLSRAVIRAQSQDALIAQSDYLTVHVPLNKETRGMIDESFLAKMKRGSVLINLSRGELVEPNAMKAALESGQLRKYVVDFPSDELLEFPGVISIPHLGASTPESEENCAQMAAAQTRDYLLYGSIRNSVNLPQLELMAPEHHRVAIIHQNIPNMISQIAQAVSDEGVNISNMVNRSRQSIAYSVLDLDSPLPEAAVQRLQAIEGAIRVRLIR